MNVPHGGPIEFVQFLKLFDRLGDGWLALTVLGIFAGFIVRFATSSKRSIGLLSTCVFGVAGAFLGVWLATALGHAPDGTGTRFLAALGGSALLALLGGLLPRGKRTSD